jgi:uncharacterized protein (DUF697 family)
MNKKRLPKAIMRTADDMREAAPALGAVGRPQVSARATDANDPADSVGAATAPVGSVHIVAPAPPVPARVGASRPGIEETRRRSLARSIVERHAAYSAVGGLIPVPLANVAGITAVIVRMVKRLSDLYGVPFERDRARAIVVGLTGGAMPTGLAAVTTSTLVYIVPGSNLIGLAVSSLAGAACTRAIGRIFVEHFESGATLIDFPVVEQSAVNASR